MKPAILETVSCNVSTDNLYSVTFSEFTKDSGILTKAMRLKDGVIIKDASQCRMATGLVRTVSVSNLSEFSEYLGKLKPKQAIGLGVSDDAHSKSLNIVKKGLEAGGSTSRTKDHFRFKLEPTLMLFDYDPAKGEPAKSIDEVYDELIRGMPELQGCEVLALGSTSSGVYREGEAQPENLLGGIHFYIIVDDGLKIPELGRVVAGRCWQQGLGRIEISKSGSLLERCLVDEAVYSPERLIFEAAPELGPGLKQLPRAYKHWPGGMLKTADVKGLSAAEELKVEELKAAAKAAKQPEADIVKAEYRKEKVREYVAKGLSKRAATEQVEKFFNGVLSGAHPLQTGSCLITATDVLRNPAYFHEWEIVDPEQSLDPGAPFKAKIYDNGRNVLIYSFRSGGRIFRIDKVEIQLDRENPSYVFDQIEAVLSTGRFPDVFAWCGALAHIGNDGVIRTLNAATALVTVGRLIRFYHSKKNKDGLWEHVTGDLPDKLWKAFLEKGSWNVPTLRDRSRVVPRSDRACVFTKRFLRSENAGFPKSRRVIAITMLHTPCWVCNE